MSPSAEASVTWARALSWRMGRQLLEPVGSASIAGVVRRLGAVLSMDEPLAELAVRTRRATSRPGEPAVALADGEVVKAFAFRGSMHYLSPEEGGIYLALRSASQQGDMSLGPPRDGRHTFQRLDSNPRWRWIPLTTLARRPSPRTSGPMGRDARSPSLLAR